MSMFLSKISKSISCKYNNSCLRNLDPIFDLPLCYGGFLSLLYILSFSVSIISLIFHLVLIFSTVIFALLHIESFEIYYVIRFIRELAIRNGNIFVFFISISVPNIVIHCSMILTISHESEVSLMIPFENLYTFFSSLIGVIFIFIAFVFIPVSFFLIIYSTVIWIRDTVQQFKDVHVKVTSISAPN